MITDLALLIAVDATFMAPVTKVSGRIWTGFSSLLSPDIEERADAVWAFSAGGAFGSKMSVAETKFSLVCETPTSNSSGSG